MFVGALILIPDDTTLEAVLRYGAAGLFFGGASVFFIGRSLSLPNTLYDSFVCSVPYFCVAIVVKDLKLCRCPKSWLYRNNTSPQISAGSGGMPGAKLK